MFIFIQLKSDYDTGDFTIKYILSGEGASEIFKIDEYTGDIYLSQRLDRELKPFYILQAQAINRSSKQPVEPESEFIIKVQDINDNAPEFINEPYVSSIPEMCPTGALTSFIYFWQMLKKRDNKIIWVATFHVQDSQPNIHRKLVWYLTYEYNCGTSNNILDNSVFCNFDAAV